MKVNIHLILSIVMIACIIVSIIRNDIFALMVNIIALILNIRCYMKY